MSQIGKLLPIRWFVAECPSDKKDCAKSNQLKNDVFAAPDVLRRVGKPEPKVDEGEMYGAAITSGKFGSSGRHIGQILWATSEELIAVAHAAGGLVEPPRCFAVGFETMTVWALRD